MTKAGFRTNEEEELLLILSSAQSFAYNLALGSEALYFNSPLGVKFIPTGGRCPLEGGEFSP
jgi:hypothetical protein